MRRSLIVLLALAAVSLAFGLSTPSARKAGSWGASLTSRIGSPTMNDVIGPGFGGSSPTVRFLGVTTQLFPVGVGALVVSRDCNEELPFSRLCERGELLRAFPPPPLDTEVLVAPSYGSNPVPVCMNVNGGPRCATSPAMKPAACCGYPPPPPKPAFLTMSPADPPAITACTDTFDLTILAQDSNHQPLEGVRTFVAPLFSGDESVVLTFSSEYGVTDANGLVSFTLGLNQASCEAFCPDPTANCSAQIQAFDQTMSISSNIVVIRDGIE